MKTMLLIHESEATWAAMAPAERDREMGAYMAFTQALIEAGKFVSGAQLQPSMNARAVTLRAGQVAVADGPYVDTKEQLGGYFLIEVASMDEAVEWAAKCPGARIGGVEVRPIFERG
jgi:hypothetical protein